MESALDRLDLAALARARWFASKGHAVAAVRGVATVAPPGAEGAVLAVCDLVDTEGGTTRYALPLRGGAEVDADDLFWPALAGLAALPGVDVPAGPGRALADDLSNTAVVLGERLVVKLVRLVEEGPSPEVEALAALDGLDGVPRFLGALESGGATVVVLQSLVPAVVGGWEPFIERLVALAAGGAGSEGVGAEIRDPAAFATDAARLLARVHVRLAERLGVETASRSTLDARREVAERDLRALAAVHPAVGVREAALLAALAGLDGLEGAPLSRIHGDAHVGQLLVRPDGSPALVDFDGEPGRPLMERGGRWTPLQDVASLLLSLDNAAAAARKRCLARGIDPAPLVPWADAARVAALEAWLEASESGTAASAPTGVASAATETVSFSTSNVLAWYNRNMGQGTGTSGGARGGTSGGVQGGSSGDLLRACEALKQIAELRYATRFLPEWLYAPLDTLERRFGGDE